MNITLYFVGYSMLGFLILTSPLRLLPLESPTNREFMIHVNSFWIILSRNTWKQLIKSRFMKISLCDLLIYKLLHCSEHAWSIIDIYIIFSCVFVYPVTQSSPRRRFGHGVEHVEKGKKDRESNNKREKGKSFLLVHVLFFTPCFFTFQSWVWLLLPHRLF